MHNTILLALMLSLLPFTASAQFYTITKETDLMPDLERKIEQIVEKRE